MGWVGMIASGVGAANEVYDRDQATAAMMREAADNKRLAYSAAADAEARGGVEAGRSRTQGTKLMAAQNTAYANSGVDPTTGTPAAVMAETQAVANLEAQTHLNNAAREAWGFRRHGLKYGQQADLDAAKASAQNTATVLGGVGRFASAAGSEYGRGQWGGSDDGITKI